MIHTFLDPSVESQFRSMSKSYNFLFGTTTRQSFTFSTSHFFSGKSRHASSSSIVLYLWLGARWPTATLDLALCTLGTQGKGTLCMYPLGRVPTLLGCWRWRVGGVVALSWHWRRRAGVGGEGPANQLEGRDEGGGRCAA
jgi:hypothetical protein